MPDLNLKSIFRKEDISKNKILLIGIAIAVISLWYGYNRIYKTTRDSLRKINIDIRSEGVNMEISTRLASLQNELLRYKVYFSKERDIPWLVDRVSKAANESGLRVVSLNSKPLVSSNMFLYSSLNIAVAGTFHQLGDFIARIENSKELIRIERLSFKKEGELLNADIVVSAYFWK